MENNSSQVDSTSDATLKCSKISPLSCAEMDEWFRNASVEQCMSMSAIQLDYRFEAEDFRTEWWAYAEPLGFTKIDFYHYKLPPSFSRLFRDRVSGTGSGIVQMKDPMIHTAKSLCMKMNTLAIPQCRNVYDRIGDDNKHSIGVLENTVRDNYIKNAAFKKDDILDHWTTVREFLIFRKFHITITKESRKMANGQKKKTGKPKKGQRSGRDQQSSSSPKRKLWSSKDAGAELFFHKGKRGKVNLPRKNSTGLKKTATIQSSDSPTINYPTTMNSYNKCTTSHKLSQIASRREKSLESCFEEWKFLISTNHSLLFYGVGSKRNLLNAFLNQCIEGDVIEVDGFDDTLTIDGILQLLIDQWLDGREPTIRKKQLFHVHFEKNDKIKKRNTAERVAPYFPHYGNFNAAQKAVAVAKRIAQQVMRTSRPITIVIHNIDGAGICNDVAQEVLGVLVSESRTNCGLKAVRIVASIDHIDGQIFTESSSRHWFHWLRKEVHTYRPYAAEVLHEHDVPENAVAKHLKASTEESGYVENGLRNADHQSIEHESIFSVLESLSSTHAESLRQIAFLQLKSGQDWVSYTDLLKQCRAARIVQADQQLRLYLGELLDHNILEREKNKDASSKISYRIPYADEILNLIWKFEPDH